LHEAGGNSSARRCESLPTALTGYLPI
jgi:hypothetical protein